MLKHCFYLLAFVLGLQVVVAVASALSCVFYPWWDLPKTVCDTASFRADLMTSFANATAAIMSFAMASKEK